LAKPSLAERLVALAAKLSLLLAHSRYRFVLSEDNFPV
jgi:hypothetical protein